MRIPAMVLLVMLAQTCQVWAQSLAPDNRYVLKAQAEYITGYPYVPRSSKDQPKKARGNFFLGLDAMRFRFCSANRAGPPDPLYNGLAGPVDNSLCEERCGLNSCQEVRIPYGRMKLLARGRVVGMGGTSEDVQVASAGIGIAGLIAGIGTGGVAEKWLIGATVGAAAVGFGFHEYSLKRANFISIFFSPRADSTLPCLETSPPPAGAASPESADAGAANTESKKPAATLPRPANLYAEANGCNVAVFQIFNSHKYWDISMILNARTGKEFVAQSAEQK